MAQPTKRLVFFEQFMHPVAEATLGAAGDIELTRLAYSNPESVNWQALEQASGFQLSASAEIKEPWRGSAALLDRCQSLLAVCSAGAGYDAIDVEACTARGVIVCNQGGANVEAVAEHAIGFMLALSKKIGLANRALLRGEAADRSKFWGNDIQNKTVGLVGLGKIGIRTGELARALGMKVIAFDPSLHAEAISERGAEAVSFDTLLEQSDFVSVHCPLTPGTRDLFDSSAFSRMKRSAYFINTSRGGIHSEQALLNALQTGQIAGAGLDVFDVEPPPSDHPLLKLDNVLATPHIAGGTYEGVEALAQTTAEQWLTIFSGKVPARLINPLAWPKYCDRFERVLGFRPEPLQTHG